LSLQNKTQPKRTKGGTKNQSSRWAVTEQKDLRSDNPNQA